MKGTYLLYISLLETSEIKYSKHLSLKFQKGYYIYIGSALGSYGSSNLLNRVKRHVRDPKDKSNHWHIDYFLADYYTELISIFLLPSPIRWECQIAQELSERAIKVIEGFGSSDCDCEGHLFYFKNCTPFFL